MLAMNPGYHPGPAPRNDETPRAFARGVSLSNSVLLHRDYVLGCRALLALDNVELHLLALGQ